MAYQTEIFQYWTKHIVRLINDHNQAESIWDEYGRMLKTRPYDFYMAYYYLHDKYHIWSSTENMINQTIHLLALEVLSRLVDYNIHGTLEDQNELEQYYRTINNYYNYNIDNWVNIILDDLDYWLHVLQNYITRREFMEYLYWTGHIDPNDTHQLYLNNIIIWAERIIYMEYLGLTTLSPLRKDIIIGYECSHMYYYINYLLKSIYIDYDQAYKLLSDLLTKFSSWLETLPYNSEHKFKIGQKLSNSISGLRLYTALLILISWRNNPCLETIFVAAQHRKLPAICNMVEKLLERDTQIAEELLPLQQCKGFLYATDSDLKCIVSN